MIKVYFKHFNIKVDIVAPPFHPFFLDRFFIENILIALDLRWIRIKGSGSAGPLRNIYDNSESLVTSIVINK